MDTEEKKFEWFLKWSGYNCWHTELRQAEKYLRGDFPLFRVSKARLVTAEEWQKMVDEGQIRDALRTENMRPFWCVSEGELGLVALSSYQSYARTWEDIDSAKTDFIEGWHAHENYLQMLTDWDEAIVEQQWRDFGEAHYSRRCNQGDIPTEEPTGIKDWWKVWEALGRQKIVADLVADWKKKKHQGWKYDDWYRFLSQADQERIGNTPIQEERKEKKIQMKVVLNRLEKDVLSNKLTMKSISDANKAGDEATEAWEREFAEYIANHSPSLPFDDDDYKALIGMIVSF